MNFFTDRFTPSSLIASGVIPSDPPSPMSETTPHGRVPASVFLIPETDEQKLTRFLAELDSALQSLDQAQARSARSRSDLDKLKGTLNDRTWWDAAKASFNGQTDKELAENIKVLGQSVEVTQKVVRVMLQIQTQKGRLLNAFSDALVKKIADIGTDTQTLDGNQRVAARAFLGELHHQVLEQIRQQDLIEEHESKLRDVDQWQSEQQTRDAALTKQLEQQQTSREQWQESKDLRDAAIEQQLQGFRSDAERFERAVADGEQAREAIQAHIDELRMRVAELEGIQRQPKPLSAIFMRHGLSLVALGMAGAALAKVLIA